MHSLFFNDSWRLNEHFTFNVGVRWDKNQARGRRRRRRCEQGLWSPRLAAIWDPSGDGRWALNGSYARYVMPMTSNVAASTTAAGNASTSAGFIRGPPSIADPNASRW